MTFQFNEIENTQKTLAHTNTHTHTRTHEHTAGQSKSFECVLSTKALGSPCLDPSSGISSILTADANCEFVRAIGNKKKQFASHVTVRTATHSPESATQTK